MKVVYYQHPDGNFGDELNKWLWPKVFPGAISGFCRHGQEFTASNNLEPVLFYGIGTMLNATIPANPLKIVFGAGCGYGAQPLLDDKFRIVFVRGPHTAKLLGVDARLALTDPAILAPHYFTPRPLKKYRLGLMPHVDSEQGQHWQNIAKALGAHYISPTGTDVELTMQAIASCELLVTEAMHGAIVADAFRVPWLAFSSSLDFNRFKWGDWCASMGLDFIDHQTLPIFAAEGRGAMAKARGFVKEKIVARQLSELIKKTRPQLSGLTVAEEKVTQIQEKIQRLAAA